METQKPPHSPEFTPADRYKRADARIRVEGGYLGGSERKALSAEAKKALDTVITRADSEINLEQLLSFIEDKDLVPDDKAKEVVMAFARVISCVALNQKGGNIALKGSAYDEMAEDIKYISKMTTA